MSLSKTSFALGTVAFVFATGCSSAPPPAGEDKAPSADGAVKPDFFHPPPVCSSLPRTYCGLDLSYQIKLPYWRTCPTISLPDGGSWTPGDPGAGIWATVYPEHPLGTAWSTSTGLYDSPYAFSDTDWVCSYAYENARTPYGTQYQSTPGVKRVDSSVICGTQQWTQIAYIVPSWQCSMGNGTSAGGRGCDTCSL